MKLKKFKFKRVKSTNNTAIRIIKESKYNKGMVIAETQTNGRGQYGRKWISSKGNLFVSFFNELNKKNLSINTITKVNCLLVKKLLSTFTRKKIIIIKVWLFLKYKQMVEDNMDENGFHLKEIYLYHFLMN